EGAHEIAGQVLLVGLERPAPDLEQLRVAQQALDGELGAVPPAAQPLPRVVGDLLPDRSGEELGGVGADAVPLARADLARDRIDQAARRFGAGIGFSDVALDLAE